MVEEQVRDVAGLLRAAARRDADGAALVEGDRRTTWGELDARVDDVARGLLDLGVARGDRVVLLLPTGTAFVVTWFAVLRAGAVAVPVTPAAPAAELGRHVAAAGARVVVAAEGLADVALASSAPRVLLAEPTGPGGPDLPTLDDLAAAGRASDHRLPDDLGGEDLAALLFTSGTSGRPRGAMLPHRALLANVRQAGQVDPPAVRGDDVVLVVLPLAHVFALNGVLGAVVRAGATAVLVDRFDPVEALRLVETEGVTVVPAAPPVFVAWSMLPDAGAALSRCRLLLSGAAALPAEVAARVEQASGLPVHQGYGLTEASPSVSSTLVTGTPRPGSIGRPLPGVEVRLVDDRGDPVDEGDPGEVVVRGANLFVGYWPDGDGGPDGDGWWRTGDVAVEDPDGSLRLVDRRKELIVVSGFNVYPLEVEQVLLESPQVREAAVLGVPHPYTGEAVRALVVPEDGRTVDVPALLDFVAARVARFKCPTSVEVVDSLPLSATGKVSKGRLREAGFAEAAADDLVRRGPDPADDGGGLVAGV